MNSLANSLLRTSLRSSSICNNVVKVFLSQSAPERTPLRRRKTLNKAMRAYIDRVKDFEQKCITESAEFETGRRFLANIMGEDPQTFNNDDVDRAIEYLLPSGIYQKFCRPEMKPPGEFKMNAKFDNTGRPFHFLFYTCKPHVNELQHETVKRINKADDLLEKIHRKGHIPEKENQMSLSATQWIDRHSLSKILNEPVQKGDYEKTIETLQTLANHPMSNHFKDFLMTYRKGFIVQVDKKVFPELQEDSDGRFFVESSSRRKRATATVKVYTSGKGKILINGNHDILYFKDVQAREQVLYPLQFTGMLHKVDLDITTSGGGFTGQSGAIRLATSTALAAIVDEEMRTKMHVAGLLAFDRRVRERKKYGQEGARRKYTWLKR